MDQLLLRNRFLEAVGHWRRGGGREAAWEGPHTGWSQAVLNAQAGQGRSFTDPTWTRIRLHRPSASEAPHISSEPPVSTVLDLPGRAPPCHEPGVGAWDYSSARRPLVRRPARSRSAIREPHEGGGGVQQVPSAGPVDQTWQVCCLGQGRVGAIHKRRQGQKPGAAAGPQGRLSAAPQALLPRYRADTLLGSHTSWAAAMITRHLTRSFIHQAWPRPGGSMHGRRSA